MATQTQETLPNMRFSARIACALLALLACRVEPALAWNRGGHMVSAAIAYEELIASDRKAIDRLMKIMEAHPDRGPFEVAVSAERSGARALRTMMQMARWADDVRHGVYDHPTWHYAARPIADPAGAVAAIDGAPAGAGAEAFALQIAIASDPRAPVAERAIAWCWIFHLAQDIHQPLHAADLYGRVFPEGDRGGSRFFVLDPQTGRPVTLHAYWDEAAHRPADAASAIARARELRKKYPRAHFGSLAESHAPSAEFARWAQESYELAKTLAYRTDAPRSASEKSARVLPAEYTKDVAAAAEQRLTLAGYRLADLIRDVLGRARARP